MMLNNSHFTLESMPSSLGTRNLTGGGAVEILAPEALPISLIYLKHGITSTEFYVAALSIHSPEIHLRGNVKASCQTCIGAVVFRIGRQVGRAASLNFSISHALVIVNLCLLALTPCSEVLKRSTLHMIGRLPVSDSPQIVRTLTSC